MTTRKFYKTRYVVEILSEEPIPDDLDLKGALNEAENGDYSGHVVSQSTKVLNGKQAAGALIDQGSDPEFFNLTRRGNDYDHNY